MKKQILLYLTLWLVSTSHAQQEYTLTTSAANISSAKALIDLPGLSGNTNAIIIATPLGNTKTMNTHPTGAWYYSGKWNIFNCDFAPMPVGMTYKVQYFLTPGANQFLHLVTLGNLGAEGSYIDNPALNNKPNVQFTIFPNHSPETRAGSWLNPNEAKAAYNASNGKWYITNIGGQLMQKGCAYNIVVSSATGSSSIDPGTNPPVASCNCPASLPPNGQATGDLAGMYPNPMVTKLLNRPLSNTPPVTGQILKWNGTEWSPSEDLANINNNTGSANVYTPGLGIDITNNEISAAASTPMWNASQILGRDILTTAPKVGQVLKWGGASWYPADDSIGSGGAATTAAITRGYFQKCYCFPIDSKASLEATHTYIISGLTQDIVAEKNSRVMVTVSVEGMNQCYTCTPGRMEVTVLDNGTRVNDVYLYFLIPANTRQEHILTNYMFDVGPGNHKIEFKARHFQDSSPVLVTGIYSSLLVIPL